MGTITIHPPVKIFDDPEVCESNVFKSDYSGCRHCDNDMVCGLFGEELEMTEEDICLKCPQCREYYQKAIFDRDNNIDNIDFDFDMKYIDGNKDQ